MSATLGAILGPMARSVSGRISASLKRRELVEGDAGQADEGAELVLHRLVGRQHHEADGRAPAETAVELGRQNAEINRHLRRAGKVERHG